MSAPVDDVPPGQPSWQRRGRLFLWFDRRMGLDRLLHEALDKPIPGGAGSLCQDYFSF